ncbi:phosphotransferase enzyme family protein [Phytoactinopolyspora halotolerans]|uniref:Phosphotransferase n=1 Tax=Phytoactinopolyspora halotolerans TaxID=1981512 RepID=A0A6L9S949_9ACTN|nr:phosphotransferase [Phytoactinopolyspora halotolerans]NEE01945.1 phosphotransferase [Phytoactinopolyspora halotolerans]
MKTLPDNPNLDHLRRQAKDLLAGLRDSHPDVSLADAQASLARQYGFRTWTDLKAEVDRLRGQADIADSALTRSVAEGFGLGEPMWPMRSMGWDNVGRLWSLETRRGRWVARTMDTWIPIVDAETDVALQLAAADHGIRLPIPVRSASGAIVESIEGHSWRVYRWLHSEPPLTAPVGAETARAAGRILGTIHRLALPVDRISPWHAARLTGVRWPDVAATTQATAAPWAPALVEAVPTLTDLETVAHDVAPPDPVLCHNNFTPGNARLAGDGTLIVVGWEQAGGQPPSWELGDALWHWAVDPDGGVNSSAVRALTDGYRSTAGSLPALDMGMFRGTVIGLGNYVYEQIEWALTSREDEDRRHADRSVSHLLSHLPTRATFERILGEVRGRP